MGSCIQISKTSQLNELITASATLVEIGADLSKTEMYKQRPSSFKQEGLFISHSILHHFLFAKQVPLPLPFFP